MGLVVEGVGGLIPPVNLLFLVLLLVPALGLGDWIVRWLVDQPGGKAEHVAYAAGLGLGVVGYASAVLGLLGLWTKPVALLLLAAAWLAGGLPGLRLLRQVWPAVWRWLRGLSSFEGIVLALLGLQALSTLIVALGPPVHGDALMGYLAMPRLWIEGGGRMVEIPYTVYDDLPGLALSLHTWILLIWPDITVALVEWSYALLFILAVYALGRRLSGPRVGLLASAAVFMTPVVTILAPSAKHDMPWALYEMLALLAILRAADEDVSPTRWAALAGLCTGLAFSLKYTSFFTLPANLLLLGWVLHRRQALQWQHLVRPVLAFGGLAVVVGAVWYVRNLVWTGNPVYPSFVGLFPGPYLPSGVAAITASRSVDGLIGFVTLPFLTSLTQLNSGLDPAQGPFWLAFLPGMLLVPRTTRRRLVPLMAYALIVYLPWFVFRQRSRDFLPAMGTLSVLAATVVMTLWDSRRFWVRWAVAGLLSVIFLLNLGVNGLGLRQPIRAAVALGVVSRAEFLAWMFPVGGRFPGPSYPATEFINRNLPHTARIAACAGENRYYLDVAEYASFTASGEVKALMSAETPAEFAALARAGGYTHLFVHWSWAGGRWDGDVQVGGNVNALSPDNQRTNLRLLYDDGYQALFAIQQAAR